MLAQITTQNLLAVRSTQELTQTCITIALRLAVLGYMSQSVDIINLSSQLGHTKQHSFHQVGLLFAWEASGTWPSVVPDKFREASYLEDYDKGLWAQRKQYKDDGQGWRARVAQEEDFKAIALFRSAWQVLKDGSMCAKWSDGEDVHSEFERLRSALLERIEKGVQRPFEELTMRQLLERLSENTVAHDYDEEEDVLVREELQKYLFMCKRSILHAPASGAELEALEHSLGTRLPEDYKEFLGTSNGLEGIWNGFYRDRDLGGTDKVRRAKLIMGPQPGRLDFPLHLIAWEELPIRIDWPELDLNQAIQIHGSRDEGLRNVWLVRPPLVRAAVAKFFEAYESEDLDDETRRTVEILACSFFGSLEGLRRLEWCVVIWSDVWMQAWPSTRDFIESLVLDSENSI